MLNLTLSSNLKAHQFRSTNEICSSLNFNRNYSLTKSLNAKWAPMSDTSINHIESIWRLTEDDEFSVCINHISDLKRIVLLTHLMNHSYFSQRKQLSILFYKSTMEISIMNSSKEASMSTIHLQEIKWTFHTYYCYENN